jgi:hypothetical protein
MLPQSDGNGGMTWTRKEDAMKFFLTFAALIALCSGAVTAYVMQGESIKANRQMIEEVKSTSDVTNAKIANLDSRYVPREVMETRLSNIELRLASIDKKLDGEMLCQVK